MNALDIRRGISVAVDTFVAHLKTRAKMISTMEEISKSSASFASRELERLQSCKLEPNFVVLITQDPPKRKPRAPEFAHKMARQALWVDGWSTPVWVKARLKRITEGSLQFRASYGTRDWSQDTPREDIPQGNGSTHMDGAGTTSEAIAVLKNHIADSKTYVKVLQTCLKHKDLSAAKQVHYCMRKSGMDKIQHVANALLNVYIRCGRLSDARRVFDDLHKKDVVTWNMMITGYTKSNYAKSALEIFSLMRQEGVLPNEITCLCILKACASPSALKWGREVHACIQHAGFDSDVRVGTALLQMYAKCGSITEARRVFDSMEKRDVVIWTTMLGGLAQHGCGHEAYRLFLQMMREGFEPDAITYLSILNASSSAGAMEWMKEVHGHARKAGLESDLLVGNALIHVYAKSGSLDDAWLVFDGMVRRDVVTWNSMIGGLAQHGCGHEAYQLFVRMRREGFEPSVVTYMSILNASATATAEALEWVKEVHGHARKALGLRSDLRLGNALMHSYAQSGSMDDARAVFDGMVKRDVITWNTMIGGLAHHGCAHEAYQLFHRMRQQGFRPNAITYIGILNASASVGALEWGKKVHGHAHETGLASDLRVCNALIHMYAKGGSIDDARLVFDSMKKRDVVTWTAMISGLAQHGYGHEALQLFREMNAARLKPNAATFAAVLSACCHAGLIDEGRGLFSAMKRDYGVNPNVVHYNCMVDLLGRAGHLKEAELFIRDMPIEPDAVTWKALLGACRTFSNVELGELAAEEVFKLEPNDTSAYVLLSNIYAAAGEWERVSMVRTTMQKRGIRKEPGRSWIQVDDKIHEFIAGDTFHPEAKALHAYIKELTEKLKAVGYIPNTQLVLQDINEEDKELALCSHSEKLAIAYGLLHIPPGEPIRVSKNLRVCPDCHSATKFISKVTGREIIARDAHRFHHFKDGVCSCGDYW